ncbi:MAG TPA: lipoyl(octanoyl) transferase LipB [Polyangiales bacterium]
MSTQARGLLSVVYLGRRDYGSVLRLQEELLAARTEGHVRDTLLLLEHTPVITLGRAARREHVLLPEAQLRAMGVELHEIGRGGDVTYHGPGQLVGYPILDLRPDRCDVRRYVAGLEETMIRLAGHYGLAAQRIAGLNGAWMGERKLGAVGVRIARWVTMHGFALNVNTDLDAFDLIVPCGIRDKQVTSLSRELGHEVSMTEVIREASRVFAEVFEYAVHEVSEERALLPPKP